MPKRKISMLVGDEVEERKRPHRRCKLRRVHEVGKDGKVKSFIVSFIDDSEEEVVRKVNEIQRQKKKSEDINVGRDVGPREKIDHPAVPSARGLGARKCALGDAGELTNRSCVFLREVGQRDNNFGSLDLQLVMCSSCEAGQVDDCKRKGEAVPMFVKQVELSKLQPQQQEDLMISAATTPEESVDEFSFENECGELEGQRNPCQSERGYGARKCAPSNDIGLACDGDLTNRSCSFLRAVRRKDPNFRSLDLQLVMCSSCKAGQLEDCKRKDEAVPMLLKQIELSKLQPQQQEHLMISAATTAESDGNSSRESESLKFGSQSPLMCGDCENGDDEASLVPKSRGMRKRIRFSFSPSQTRANGARLTQNQQRPRVDLQCRAETPSKVNPRTLRRVVNKTGIYLTTAFPNMNSDGKRRVFSKVLTKGAKQAARKASVQLKSTFCVEITEVELRELRANSMSVIVGHLKNLSPREQIPTLASLTDSMNVNIAQRICEMDISKRTWTRANRHRIDPGPFKPAKKVVVTRCRTKKEKVSSWFDFLETQQLLQQHAVGTQRHMLVNGEEHIFDNISLTADSGKIMRDYGKLVESVAVQDGIEVPQDVDRCKAMCRKSGVRCLLRKDHKQGTSRSQCKYTPGSLFSPSSIERVLAAATNGSLKSLAGLDDEDVEKGYNNFKKIREIATRVYNRLGMSKCDTDKLKKTIDEVQVFIETSFVGHTKKHAEHICGCISCGFTSPPQTPSETGKKKKKNASEKKKHCETVPCQRRENGTHKGSCEDCEKCFEMFSTLLTNVKNVQQLPSATEIEKDDYYELELEVKERRELLKQLRAHKVRKKTESDYDRQQLKSLKRNECIVICDFKMKILSQFHRENQKLFFGKHGIACLGFMVVTPCDDTETSDEVGVNYYLLFSNDTTQDANFVLSAKAALYTEILPTLFPHDIGVINAHFRTDGAGCFNCNAAKAAMPMWICWTSENEVPVDEISYRVSVNGGGKTSLDGTFAHLKSNLDTSVNNGLDITHAESCMDAYEDSSGIRGTAAAVFSPVRDHIIDTSFTGLNVYHHLKKNADKDSIQGFLYSGFGEGVEISVKSIEEGWILPDATRTTPAPDATPPMPNYVIAWQSETRKSAEHVTHSTESKISRNKQRDTEKASSREAKRNKAWEEECNENLEKGIQQCKAVDPTGKGRCQHSFLSLDALAAHERSGNHRYRSQNLVDQAVCEVARAGGIMAAGSHRNRLDEYNERVNVQEGKGLGNYEGSDWCGVGWAEKSGRKPNAKFTLELKKDLLELFIDGEKAEGGNKKGKAKYTKEEAHAKLNDMRREDNFRKYSSSSKFGPLPTKAQITNIFAGFKKLKGEGGVDGLEVKLACMIKELKKKGDTSGDNAVAETSTRKRKTPGCDDTAESNANETRKSGSSKKNMKSTRKKNDPNEPKRPLTAYMLFSQSIREQVKKEDPDNVVS